MATAKFSSIRAEEVLALGVLGFCQNRLDLGVRKESARCDICVVNGHLLFEIQQVVQVGAKPLVSPATEPIPDVWRMPVGWLLLEDEVVKPSIVSKASVQRCLSELSSNWDNEQLDQVVEIFQTHGLF